MIVGAVDTAYSVAVTADLSAIVVAKIFIYQGKSVAYIVDVVANRWRYDELGLKIVETFSRHGVQRAMIERGGPWMELQANMQRQAGARGIVLPHIVFKQSTATGTSVPRKVIRLKGAQSAMENDQLYFAPAPWNDSLFNELVHFTGKKSTANRKDDRCDALGHIVENYVTRDTGSGAFNASDVEADQQAYESEFLRQQHNWLFGSGTISRPPVDQEPEPPSAREHYFGFGRFSR